MKWVNLSYTNRNIRPFTKLNMKRGCSPLRNFSLPSSLYTFNNASISPVYFGFYSRGFCVIIFDRQTSNGFVKTVARKLETIRIVSLVVNGVFIS